MSPAGCTDAPHATPLSDVPSPPSSGERVRVRGDFGPMQGRRSKAEGRRKIGPRCSVAGPCCLFLVVSPSGRLVVASPMESGWYRDVPPVVSFPSSSKAATRAIDLTAWVWRHLGVYHTPKPDCDRKCSVALCRSRGRRHLGVYHTPKSNCDRERAGGVVLPAWRRRNLATYHVAKVRFARINRLSRKASGQVLRGLRKKKEGEGAASPSIPISSGRLLPIARFAG
jgi:hypothetical protein